MLVCGDLRLRVSEVELILAWVGSFVARRFAPVTPGLFRCVLPVRLGFFGVVGDQSGEVFRDSSSFGGESGAGRPLVLT